jgi:hypothetical protein
MFTKSRVGSTLVANFLASDPWSLVFSESTPIANAILHCESCALERKVQLFRDVVLLMGRSPFHHRLFFKFQSITCTKMDIALLVSSLTCPALSFGCVALLSPRLEPTGVSRDSMGIHLPRTCADNDVASGPAEGIPRRALPALQEGSARAGHQHGQLSYGGGEDSAQ